MFLAIPEHKEAALKDKWDKDKDQTQSQLAGLPFDLKWNNTTVNKNKGYNWLM